MQSEQLIKTLAEQTKQIISQVEKLENYDLDTLTWKQNADTWSILECLEHLNLYGNFYLPQIESKIENSQIKSEVVFKPGILGDYFAKSMLPKEKLNKMKTFKDKNPLSTKLDKNVIDEFVNQQNILLNLLNNSRNVSLNKVLITTSISRLIRIKLGDTFRFLINHNIRHWKQIEKIQAKMVYAK